MEDELAALAAFVGGGHRHFDAELVRRPALPFPMHSTSVRARNRASSRAGAASGCGSAPPRLSGMAKVSCRLLVAVDLAPDIADHPAQADAQEFDLPVHALELFGVSIAPGHHRCLPGERVHIGLTAEARRASWPACPIGGSPSRAARHRSEKRCSWAAPSCRW